jgi:hypothetical protein
MLHSRHPLAEARRRTELIGHLVQMAAALVQERRWHLPGQAQHRLVASPSRQQPRRGIQQSGARNDGAYGGAAGGAGVAKGHVAARLLVTRTDGAHSRLGLIQGIEKTVGLCTGQPEHCVHPVREQRINERLPAGAVVCV